MLCLCSRQFGFVWSPVRHLHSTRDSPSPEVFVIHKHEVSETLCDAAVLTLMYGLEALCVYVWLVLKLCLLHSSPSLERELCRRPSSSWFSSCRCSTSFCNASISSLNFCSFCCHSCWNTHTLSVIAGTHTLSLTAGTHSWETQATQMHDCEQFLHAVYA